MENVCGRLGAGLNSPAHRSRWEQDLVICLVVTEEESTWTKNSPKIGLQRYLRNCGGNLCAFVGEPCSSISAGHPQVRCWYQTGSLGFLFLQQSLSHLPASSSAAVSNEGGHKICHPNWDAFESVNWVLLIITLWQHVCINWQTRTYGHSNKNPSTPRSSFKTNRKVTVTTPFSLLPLQKCGETFHFKGCIPSHSR